MIHLCINQLIYESIYLWFIDLFTLSICLSMIIYLCIHPSIQVDLLEKQILRWRLVGRMFIRKCSQDIQLQEMWRSRTEQKKWTMRQSWQKYQLTPQGTLRLGWYCRVVLSWSKWTYFSAKGNSSNSLRALCCWLVMVLACGGIGPSVLKEGDTDTHTVCVFLNDIHVLL